MDIEQELPTSPHQNHLSLQIILKQTQKHQMNIKRVVSLASKVEDKNNLYEQLTCIAQKTTDLDQKVNIFAVIVQILAGNKEQLYKQADYFAWLIKQIFNLRRQLDSLYIETEQKVRLLSNILKIIDQIISTSNKLEKSQMQQATVVDRLYNLMMHLQSQKQFESLQNSLCSLHVLEKLSFKDSTFQYSQLNLMKVYMQSIFRNGYYDHQIQEVIVNTALHCINKFNCLQEDYVNFVEKAPFYMQLLSLLKFRLQMALVVNRVECNFEEEFQLITLIVEKYYPNHQSEIKKQLCWFWLKNYCNMFLRSGYIEIQTYIGHLSIEVLDYLLKMLTQELNECQNPTQRILLLIIWKSVLVDDRTKGKLISNSVVFQSVQLLLYKFLRQIVNQLPCTLYPEQIYSILSVYTQYFHCILRQRQCNQLRIKITSYYINNYLELISPMMLLLPHYVSSYQKDNLIDLSHYDNNLIQSILSHYNRSADTISTVLSKVNNQVGIVFIKYLSQIDSPELKAIFMKGTLVDYVIENNIELHDEKIDYALHQKLSKNLQKYMRIMRQAKVRNRYEGRINAFIVDLLGNQIDQIDNVKLLPANFSVFIYLVEKLENLFFLSQEKGQTVIKFINCLYGFAQRSLYQHVPDAIYLLLLAIAELKERYLKQITVLQQEMALISNLVKFCSHYSTQTSYALVGYATILLLIYGSPCSAFPTEVNRSVQEFMQTQGYFLQKISSFLEKQVLKNNKTFGFERKKAQIVPELYQSFWQVFRKNLLTGLMKNLDFAAHKNFQRHRVQILNQREFIHRLILSEIKQDKPNQPSEIQQKQSGKRMRYLSLSEDESSLEEQREYSKNNYRRLITRQKVATNISIQPYRTFLEEIIQKGIQLNQFQEIRQIYLCLSKDCQENNSECLLSQLLSSNSTLCRVHGKIRSIVHVKK